MINRLMKLSIKRVNRTMLIISIKISNKIIIITSQLPSKAITTLKETSRISPLKKKTKEAQTSSHSSSNPKIDSLATTKEKVYNNNNNKLKEVLAMKVSFWTCWTNLTKAETKGTKALTNTRHLSKEWSNSNKTAIHLNKISAQLLKPTRLLGYLIRWFQLLLCLENNTKD